MLDYCSSLVANDAAHVGYTPHHLHHHHSSHLSHHSPGAGSNLGSSSSSSSSGAHGHSPTPTMASILGMTHSGTGSLDSSSSPRLSHHQQSQQQQQSHQQQQQHQQHQQQQQQQQAHQQQQHQQQQQQSAFLLSSPPLAALHNLTEMKFPSSSNASFLGQEYSPDALKQMHAAMSHALSTPHGINDILSRPHAALGLPRLGAAAAAAGMYHHLGAHHQSRFPKLAELPGRPPIYWPGVLPQPWRPPGELPSQSLQTLSSFYNPKNHHTIIIFIKVLHELKKCVFYFNHIIKFFPIIVLDNRYDNNIYYRNNKSIKHDEHKNNKDVDENW